MRCCKFFQSLSRSICQEPSRADTMNRWPSYARNTGKLQIADITLWQKNYYIRQKINMSKKTSRKRIKNKVVDLIELRIFQPVALRDQVSKHTLWSSYFLIQNCLVRDMKPSLRYVVEGFCLHHLDQFRALYDRFAPILRTPHGAQILDKNQ